MSAEVIGTEESTVSDCGYTDNTGSQEQFIVVCGLSWTLSAKGKTEYQKNYTLCNMYIVSCPSLEYFSLHKVAICIML